MKDRTRDNHFKNPRKGKFGKDNLTAKQVFQYNKNNELIKIWESILEASRSLNISQSNISKCCRKEKYRKTAGGFIWRYDIVHNLNKLKEN